jgi:hypothetical protein
MKQVRYRHKQVYQPFLCIYFYSRNMSFELQKVIFVLLLVSSISTIHDEKCITIKSQSSDGDSGMGIRTFLCGVLYVIRHPIS